jgi:hypothetical protein
MYPKQLPSRQRGQNVENVTETSFFVAIIEVILGIGGKQELFFPSSA